MHERQRQSSRSDSDFEGAVRALTEANELVGLPDKTSSWYGVQGTIRISALTFLAYCAGHLRDRQRVLSAIAEALAMLDSLGTPAPDFIRQDEFLRTWQKWAHEYVAWAALQDIQ